MTSNYQSELDVAVSIAQEAGEIMIKYFDADQKVERKEDRSLVTIADKLINTLAIKRLKVAFPNDEIIGEEEATSEYGMGRKWFCDPIDGTSGYIWGTPTAMFSLALVIDGRPVIGVAYDPFLDRMYIGRKGEVTTCNDRPIHVSDLDLKSGIFAVSGSIKSLPKTPYYQKMVEDKIQLATFSGAVYKCCLVAKGKFTGYIEAGVNAHDIAAAELIVEGAGGKVTSPAGEVLDYSTPFKGVLVSNSVAHNEILGYLK